MFYRPSALGLLAPLSRWLEDDCVTEIMLNEPQWVYIEKNRHMHRYRVDEFTAIHLHQFLQLVASESHQCVNSNYPMMSATLENGCRIQLVFPPLCAFLCFAIRKPNKTKLNLQDFCGVAGGQGGGVKAITDGAAAEQLRQAVLNQQNVLVSGGTSSGKTSLINACLPLIPSSSRLLLLEDTAELQAPHGNQLRLVLPPATGQTVKITMQDLLQASLRLRPDRIIIGELRGREVADYLMANNTGHRGSLASIHANSADEAILRIKQLYQLACSGTVNADLLHQQIRSAIDCVVQVKREGRRHFITEFQSVQ